MIEKKHNYIFIFSLVAIISILTLSLNQVGILDAAVTLDKKIVENGEYNVVCKDSDPLNYYGIKGLVKYKEYQYKDYCSDGKLFQVYCASSKVVRMTRGFRCLNGCFEGACLPKN